VSSLAKYPVEIETASRLNQFVFAGTFREEIETTLHGDTDERNTQRNRGGEQYDAQISGIKGRLYVSETIVGSLKNRFRAVEKVVFVQEKEISTLASETKVQGDIIKQQSDELEELRLMIQGLQELCIKNDGNKGKLMDFSPHPSIWNIQYGTTRSLILDFHNAAADVVAPEKEKRDDGKKKKAGRIGKNVLIEDQNGETPVVVLPEIKVLNRLLKKELQNLCGKHRIAFCADKDTRPVLISKLTATLKTE
jgi:hypothetical protein